jgi:predicted DNA-binding transcriptional regulator AlpA
MMQDQQSFLPAADVCARYGVSDMSLWRWLRDEALDFPQPLRIHRRRLWKLADLEAWETSRLTREDA